MEIKVFMHDAIIVYISMGFDHLSDKNIHPPYRDKD